MEEQKNIMIAVSIKFDYRTNEAATAYMSEDTLDKLNGYGS